MAAQDPAPANGDNKRKWQDVALEVTQEQDPKKFSELCAELLESLDEQRRQKTPGRPG